MAWRPLASGLLLALTLLVRRSGSVPEPQKATWSTRTFGYDGPWNTVNVTIGPSYSPGINLFVGRRWASTVITKAYCQLNSSESQPACDAGAYDEEASGEDIVTIAYRPGAETFAFGLDTRGDNLRSLGDDMDLHVGDVVANASLVLVDSQMVEYPGGTWYPLSGGCLSVGARGQINQTFDDSPSPVNTSMVPGYLFSHDTIPSNSFGMHIGAATPPLAGSLWFGGYDSKRVVGPVLETGEDAWDVTLRDISIQVISGESPWDWSMKSDLLVSDGSDGRGGSGMLVTVDGCSPYLTLPKPTCDKIAALLPVKYRADLGLYLWDINDPKYRQIITSPSVLAFVFVGSTNTESITVRVPFVHLNLTLSRPLADSPIPYFPCFTGGQGQPVLGRAFLQDAFLGANWDSKRLWMAQAPGPNISLADDATPIGPDDTSIQAGANDWATSWSGTWTELKPSDVGKNGTGPPQGDSGLSHGAIGGIVVAVVVGLTLLGLSVYWYMFRKRKSGSAPNSTMPTAFGTQPDSPAPAKTLRPPGELDANQSQQYREPHELSGQQHSGNFQENSFHNSLLVDTSVPLQQSGESSSSFRELPA